jgi:hypothetical protein
MRCVSWSQTSHVARFQNFCEDYVDDDVAALFDLIG